MTNFIVDMHSRLNYLEKRTLGRIKRMRRYVDQNRIGGEQARLWLDEQVKELGDGLDICCGDFLIRGAEGVDGDLKKVGPTYCHVSGDELTNHFAKEMDFIVTNYLEAFPNTLKALNEWNRVLKKDGLLALVCADSEQYEEGLGPLSNRHRLNCFTKTTIRHYLNRSGFSRISVESGLEKTLYVKAYK
jgi:SAM-dependent methyltransferase